MGIKEFMDSLPTFSQMERIKNFRRCGLFIKKLKDGMFFEYVKINRHKYCAMVFNPKHYEKELNNAKDEIMKKISKILKKRRGMRNGQFRASETRFKKPQTY